MPELSGFTLGDLILWAIFGFGIGVGTTVFVLRTPLRLGAQAYEEAQRCKRKKALVQELAKLTNHGAGAQPRLIGAKTEIRE